MTTKSKLIKVLGLAATVIGVAATLVTDWVNEQKMDEKIEEKVNEALAKRDDEIEESEQGLFFSIRERFLWIVELFQQLKSICSIYLNPEGIGPNMSFAKEATDDGRPRKFLKVYNIMQIFRQCRL